MPLELREEEVIPQVFEVSLTALLKMRVVFTKSFAGLQEGPIGPVARRLITTFDRTA